MNKPLILLTNDDGVYAPGLKAICDVMRNIGRIVVVAPERDNSAASHSLTMHRPLRVRKIDEDVYMIDGTPTDCVTIGIGMVLDEKPALVVSGINPGGNLGDDISYSGTVSAAVEGTMLGVPSFAVSLAGEAPFDFSAAAEFSGQLAGKILDKGLFRETLLNVNVPNISKELIKGVRYTRQGRRIYEGAIKETSDPWGRKHYWIGGGTPLWDGREDTDASAVLKQYVSITPIHLDLTNYDALSRLRQDWPVDIDWTR
ncbi:MAG: 5'/3'-nucleotidase SurE [Proteobacteria bacterium]|nr:5'/3'-nucleotidase SurE [Pseudomonadota bacterium]MBU1708931.1 5'/3'-nucleotidase SurE [Pseudomonadota bacterium]